MESEVDVLVLLLIFFVLLVGAIVLVEFPSVNQSIEQLELEDTLAEYHVLKYYPKFENCTIKYDCIDIRESCRYGAKVYCGDYEKLESLDGMKVVEESRIPTKELIFDDIKLKDIYWDWKADWRADLE